MAMRSPPLCGERRRAGAGRPRSISASGMGDGYPRAATGNSALHSTSALFAAAKPWA